MKNRKTAKGPATLPGTISGVTAEDAARFLEAMYAARQKWWDEHGQRLWEEREAERRKAD